VTPAHPKAAIIVPHRVLDLVYGPDGVAAIGRETELVHPPVAPDELRPCDEAWLARAEVLFTGWGAPRLDAAMLARMPALRAVFHAGGTVRAVVTGEVWKRGIVVTTAAAANGVPVAEFTFACIVFGLKRVWFQNRLVRERRTFPSPGLDVPGAYGSSVGLVSLGKIAQMVCARLRTIDVRVRVHDPVVDPSLIAEHGAEPASLESLFATSDVVSIHAPWLPETDGLITGGLVRRMKPGATLINTARGAVVAEDELCAVLRERPDLQAVIDVTRPEPPAADSPLYDLPNVFLTPHIAGSQAAECRRLGLWVIDDFRRWARGEPLREQVTEANASLQA
jgi:phosphoglycerate dehydrogenase-like enzyme